MKKHIVKLKNLYSGSFVFSEENVKKLQKEPNVEFIQVYSESNPNRKYLVNKNSFVIVSE
jgi:hypothetical protein